MLPLQVRVKLKVMLIKGTLQSPKLNLYTGCNLMSISRTPDISWGDGARAFPLSRAYKGLLSLQGL